MANTNFEILELAVMYTALKERLQRLQKLLQMTMI